MVSQSQEISWDLMTPRGLTTILAAPRAVPEAKPTRPSCSVRVATLQVVLHNVDQWHKQHDMCIYIFIYLLLLYYI